MANVVIDGVPYTPTHETVPNVGVAITTRDRPEQLAHCLEQVGRFSPPNFKIVVVDDASKIPPASDYRFESNVGIPAAKNKCLELLMDSGVEHLFLLDNDAYPVCEGWWRPFVESPEPHLMGQFLDLEGQKLNDITILYQDNELEAYTGPRGYCLYYHRSVIEQVGGFDPVFGMGLFEHGDLSNRIFARGLTTWRYASPKDSVSLVESGDRLRKVQRTPLPDRQALVDRNRVIHDERLASGFDGFVPYRLPRTVVLTSLLTGLSDPQRGRRMKPHPSALAELVGSVGENPIVVFADELEDVPGASVVKVPTTVNPYFARWIHALKYLKAADVDYALLCDGTDVKLLKPKRLAQLPHNKLLVGSENQILDCEWMRKNHPHPKLQTLFDEHGSHTLLNAGCLAGPKHLLVDFLTRFVHTWADMETDAWHKKPGAGEFEMGLFCYTALTWFKDQLLFGPWVTTTFKAGEVNEISMLKHK